MLFEIAKKIILIFLLLCLVGCTELEEEEENHKKETNINCGYNYIYGCGFDVMSGTTKCGYGYYYTCRI